MTRDELRWWVREFERDFIFSLKGAVAYDISKWSEKN